MKTTRLILGLCVALRIASSQSIPSSYDATSGAPSSGIRGVSAASTVATSSFSASNVLSEYFPSPTPNSGTVTWTINSDNYATGQAAVAWYSSNGAQSTPGFNFYPYGHGAASTPWPIGSGPFDLKFDHLVDSAVTQQIPTKPVIAANQYGAQVGVCTSPAASLTYQDYCIYWAVQQNGWRAMVVRGIPEFEQGMFNYNASNVISSVSGDGLTAGTWIYLGWAKNGGVAMPGWWQVATGATSLVCSSGPSGICPNNTLSEVPYSGFYELSNLNTPILWQGVRASSVPLGTITAGSGSYPPGEWPQAAGDNSLGGLPLNAPQTFEITKDGSGNLTFTIYFQENLNGGINPYSAPYVQYTCSLTPGTGSCVIPAGAAPSFAYLNVTNLNANRTNWSGGATTSANPGAPAAGNAINQVVYNIRGYGTTSGTMPTVTGIVPSGSSTTFTAGAQATITGTNLQPGSTISIGPAITLGAPAATTDSYVQGIAATGSGTALTFTLPSSGATNCTVNFSTPCPTHRIWVVDTSGVEIPIQTVTPWQQIYSGLAGSNMGWPVQPPGIIYSAGGVLGIDPIDVVPGDTLTINGSGFSSNTTISIGGTNCPVISVVSPIQLTCTAPSKSAGIQRVVTANPAFDSSTVSGANYFDFGYGGHPLLMAASQLSTAQSTFASATSPCPAWTPTSGPCMYDYAEPLTRNIQAAPTPGTSFNSSDYTGVNWQKPADYLNHAVVSTSTAGADITSAYSVGLAQTLGNFAFTLPQTINAANLEMPLATTYDLLMASPSNLTIAQRIQFLRNLKFYQSFCNSMQTSGDSTFKGTLAFGSGSYNWLSVNNGTCGVTNVDLVNVEPNVYLSGGATSNLATFIRYASQYYSTEYFADGAPVEGGQYAMYGQTPNAWLGMGLINANGGLTGSSAPSNLLTTSIQRYATWAANAFGAGQSFDRTALASGCADFATWTNADTQPQHYNPVLPFIYSYVSGASSQLLGISDCQQHQIANGNPYTGYLEQQVSNSAYDLLAFLGRSGNSSTPAPAFGGWAMINGSSSASGGPTINGVIATNAGCSTVSSTNLCGSNIVTMRSDGINAMPDISLIFMGKSSAGLNHDAGSQLDTGSFALSALGDPTLIDPGYNAGGAAQHSGTKVGSVEVGNVAGGGVITAAQPVGSAGGTNLTRQGVTMNLTSAYSGAGLTSFYRTIATYQTNSSNSTPNQGRAIVILDDINGTNSTSIVTRFQSVRGVATQTTNTPYSWTLSGGAGSNSMAQILFYGQNPTLTSAAQTFVNAGNLGTITGASTASAVGSAPYCVSGAGFASAQVSPNPYRLGGPDIQAGTYIIGIGTGGCPAGQAQISQAAIASATGLTLYAQQGASWVFDALQNGLAGASNLGYNFTWKTLNATWSLPATGTTNATPLVTVILIGNSNGVYEPMPTVTITPSTSVNIAFASGGTVSFSYSGGRWILN